MTTLDKSKRAFRIKLREVSGEKRVHMEVCNAEDLDFATEYARAKLGPTGLVLESVWEVDPTTGKKI